MRTPKEICKEVTGTRPMPMDDIYKAMSIHAKEKSILFIEYYEMFRREESRSFKKECDRLGGIFSFMGARPENIYNDFINRKPIKSAMFDFDTFWQYNDKDELIHFNPQTL